MRLPLNMVQSEAQRLEAERECGTCTACCVLPRIPLDEEPGFFPQGKRGYTPCQHLCSLGEGCSIYNERPGLCRDYKCLWRAGLILGDERRRPDNLGLMFTLDEHEGQGVVEVWELWEGAARDHPGRGMLDAVSKYARVHIRFYGVPAAINYENANTLELGRRLSLAARVAPPELAAWLEARIGMGDLTVPQQKSVMLDLDALREGKSIESHYNRR